MFLFALVFVVGTGPDLPTDMSHSYLMMLYIDVVGIYAVCGIQPVSVVGGIAWLSCLATFLVIIFALIYPVVET